LTPAASYYVANLIIVCMTVSLHQHDRCIGNRSWLAYICDFRSDHSFHFSEPLIHCNLIDLLIGELETGVTCWQLVTTVCCLLPCLVHPDWSPGQSNTVQFTVKHTALLSQSYIQ